MKVTVRIPQQMAINSEHLGCVNINNTTVLETCSSSFMPPPLSPHTPNPNDAPTNYVSQLNMLPNCLRPRKEPNHIVDEKLPTQRQRHRDIETQRHRRRDTEARTHRGTETYRWKQTVSYDNSNENVSQT